MPKEVGRSIATQRKRFEFCEVPKWNPDDETLYQMRLIDRDGRCSNIYSMERKGDKILCVFYEVNAEMPHLFHRLDDVYHFKAKDINEACRHMITAAVAFENNPTVQVFGDQSVYLEEKSDE